MLTNAQFPSLDQKKSICIFVASKRTEPWDPRSTQQGISGSLEAVIYLSEQLAKLGYRVTVVGNPPSDSPYSDITANPRYVTRDYIPLSKFDYAVVWRLFWLGKLLKNIANKVYFWPHDIAINHYTADEIDAYDGIFWLSDWQREQWISLNPALSKFTPIYGNGIDRAGFDPAVERSNPYSCIYGSNYAKGLDILLDCWPEIKKRYPRASLDIYYGWCTWAGLPHKKEQSMKNQIADYSTLDVSEHGMVSHNELHKAYSQASLWTYPCKVKETFCISALKAQAAGAIPVIIKGSALLETVRYGYSCSTAEDYPSTLIQAMGNIKQISINERKLMGNSILEEYSWEKVAERWKSGFENYPRAS